MPIRALGGSTGKWFSLLSTAYWRARSKRTSWNWRSRSNVYVPMRRPDGCGTKSFPSTSTSGMIGRTRCGSRSTVPVPSATPATTFTAHHSPDARDSAMPWRPRSRACCTSPGYSTGIWRSTMVASDDDGNVEDLALGSSPTRAMTPPWRWVPANTAWRMASDARSSPGALPYQTPMTPS